MCGVVFSQSIRHVLLRLVTSLHSTMLLSSLANLLRVLVHLVLPIVLPPLQCPGNLRLAFWSLVGYVNALHVYLMIYLLLLLQFIHELYVPLLSG